jgi:hypothetical protein
MAKLLAARRGDPVQVMGVRDPDDADREVFESGALSPGPHATLARPTFADSAARPTRPNDDVDAGTRQARSGRAGPATPASHACAAGTRFA